MQDSVRLMLDRDGDGVHHEGGFREFVRTADAPCVPLPVLARPDRAHGDRGHEPTVRLRHDGVFVPDLRRERGADLRSERYEDGDGREEGNENGDSENSFHFVPCFIHFIVPGSETGSRKAFLPPPSHLWGFPAHCPAENYL